MDGLDWNNFFSRRFYTFDLGSYSLSNFYPLFFVDDDIELDCEIHSNGGGWQDPYNQNRLHFQITSRGWTDTRLSFHLLSQDIYDINEITIGSIGIGTHQGGICIWVRGGRTYRVCSNREPLFRSSNYTYGDEIYSVGTNIWGGTNTNVNIVWKNDSTRKNALIATLTDNVASATKLATARKIWGQLFDGTADVDGELVVNGQIRSSFASNNGNPCIMVNPTNDTDWCYGIEVLATKLTAGHRTGAYWAGKTNSTNNAICMSYYHAGDGSEDNRLIWHTWGSGDKMMLTANGRVGIGATPSYKLHVDGDIYTTTGFKKNGSSDSYVLLGGGGHSKITDLSVANADTVDGYHANSLLTALSNSDNGISITVGGTTKSVSNISVNYASSAGNADTVDYYHADSLFRDLGWWNYNDTHDADNISGNGAVFAYAEHSNVPNTGVLVTFKGGNDGYRWQMSKSYWSKSLHIRQRNGDNGTWSNWLRLLDESDLIWDNIAGKPSSFTPSAHSHSWTSITDKIVAGNEFNIVNAGFNAGMWFNYLPINDRSKTATITGYHFGNGATGYTSITASGFVKNGSSSNYVLLGDGGHQTISSLSVNYANSAGNADTA